MRLIWVVAYNTFREIIRDRILYALLVFALLLIGLSLALGQLSFREQARIAADYGFTAIHISMMILSVFIGSTLVNKEIEKKTVLTLLARPLSRLQFLIGKVSGLTLVTTSLVLGFALVMGIILSFLGFELSLSFGTALWGILLESLILVGLCVFFSCFSKSLMVSVFTLGFFLIGHWMNSLQFFAEKSETTTFKFFASFVSFVVPNLERLNWRSLPIYQESLPFQELFLASAYALTWFGVLIAWTAFLLRKKDLG